ncbi:MAG TPA: hypothetical protein VGL56_19880 [Fimbriimonadaceae bacterium]|jgi:hypothetical protein
MRALIVGIVALTLFAFTTPAKAQEIGEKAWEIAPTATTQAAFVATDDQDNIYVVVNNPDGSATINIYDTMGVFINSIGVLRTVTGFQVSPFTGTMVVNCNGNIEWYEWNGSKDAQTGPGTVIGFGTDGGGGVLMVQSYQGATRIDLFDGRDDYSTTIPVAASSAQVDPQGRILLIGSTGTLQSGTVFANFYSENGTSLWKRSYNTSIGLIQSIGAFTEDSEGLGYLIVNTTGSIEDGGHGTVECIDPNNGATDLWESAPLSGPVHYACAGFVYLYVAGSSFLTNISIYTQAVAAGNVVWTVPQNVSGLVQTQYGALVESYDAANFAVDVIGFDGATGTINSRQTAPAPSQSNMGELFAAGRLDAEYFGSTTSSNTGPLLVKYVYGSIISSIVVPASVVGGSYFELTLNLLEAPFLEFNVPITSSNPTALNMPSSEQINTQSKTYSLPTSPVDKDTLVELTGTQNPPGVQKFASLTVKTATASICSTAVPSLYGPQTTTGTVTLTGPAGPSGKLVSLSSNNAAVSVPSTVSVAAGQSTATFAITSKPVSADTVISVTASLGTAATVTMTVLAAKVNSVTATSSVIGGNPISSTLTLNAVAGPSGSSVSLTSSSPAVKVPTSESIAAGQTSGSFVLQTTGVSATTSVTLSGTLGGVTKSAVVVVNPAAFSLFTLAHPFVSGGTSVIGQITLNGQAGPSGTVVKLSTSDSFYSQVPASVTVPAGKSTAQFVVKTHAVTASRSIRIVATFNGVTKAVTLSLAR